MDSGWNCTPQRGRVRCLSAIRVPSSAQATASSDSGSGSATASEWYRTAVNSWGMPSNSPSPVWVTRVR